MNLRTMRCLWIERALVSAACGLALGCGGDETEDTSTLGCTESCDASTEDDSTRDTEDEPSDESDDASSGDDSADDAERDDETADGAESGDAEVDDANVADAEADADDASDDTEMDDAGSSDEGAPAADPGPGDDETPGGDASASEPPPELVEGIVPSAGQLLALSACENRNPDWRRVEGSERGITLDIDGLSYTAEFVACHVTNDGVLSCRELSVLDELTAGGLGNVSDLGIGLNAVAVLNGDGQLTIPGKGTFDGTFRQIDGNLAIDQYGKLSKWFLVPDGPIMVPGPVGSYRRVSAYAGGYCALDLDGELTCWDENDSAGAPQPAGPFRFVSASAAGHCAIREDDELYCWTGASSNQDWGEFNGTQVQDVDNAGGRICVRTLDGQAECWSALDGVQEVSECLASYPAR